MCLRQLGWQSSRPGLAGVAGAPGGQPLPLGTLESQAAASGGGGLWGWRQAVATGGHLSLGCPSAPLLISLPLGCAPRVEEPAEPATARHG